jgi:hypothetical protein
MYSEFRSGEARNLYALPDVAGRVATREWNKRLGKWMKKIKGGWLGLRNSVEHENNSNLEEHILNAYVLLFFATLVYMHPAAARYSLLYST